MNSILMKKKKHFPSNWVESERIRGYLWQNWHNPAHCFVLLLLSWINVSCFIHLYRYIYFFIIHFCRKLHVLLAVGMSIILGEFSTLSLSSWKRAWHLGNKFSMSPIQQCRTSFLTPIKRAFCFSFCTVYLCHNVFVKHLCTVVVTRIKRPYIYVYIYIACSDGLCYY